MVNWIEESVGCIPTGATAGTYQAVDLVRDGRGEDGHALIPVDGVGEVAVFLGVVDPLEAHALCDSGLVILVCGASQIGMGEGSKQNILGMRPFHLCRTSSVKNSDVFIGAYEVSYSKRVSF